MILNIFDVEHGACALLTCDNNARTMIDCGHNGSTGWRPGTHLRSQGITQLERLIVTNYDEDHVSGIANLLDNVNVQWLTRNPSVSAGAIRYLKSEDGMGAGIERLVYAIENTFTGSIGPSSPMPHFQGLTVTTFNNTPQQFDDENNLSLVTHLKCHNVGFLFPGDLERAGWLELLKRPDFQAVLRDTHVLIAPHHGRESGCCEEAFNYLNPFYVIISDKGYAHETQETLGFYRRFTKGGPFRTEGTRHILTTRNDGTINFYISASGWYPY